MIKYPNDIFYKKEHIELSLVKRESGKDDERDVIIVPYSGEIETANDSSSDNIQAIRNGTRLISKIPEVSINYGYEGAIGEGIYHKTHILWINKVNKWICVKSESEGRFYHFMRKVKYTGPYLPNEFLCEKILEAFKLPHGTFPLEEIVNTSNYTLARLHYRSIYHFKLNLKRSEPDWEKINASFRKKG